jgi:hypothetical protein
MALATKSPQQQRTLPQKLWKTPLTRSAWVLLIVSLLLYGGVYLWFYLASKTTQPDPASDPYRIFGIIAFALVLVVASYSLRRRFVRTLPGKVENWLWMHTWLGIVSILIALLHENYQNVIGYHTFDIPTFTASAGGMSALYALILLVLSGIFGRLLDVFCARIIAKEASSNGVGIIQALEGQLHTLDLLLERLCAGKSEAFKHYCMQGHVTETLPQIPTRERGDLQQAVQALTKKATLQRSLARQQLARRGIRVWRYIHITLACLALVVICIHATTELRQMLLDYLGKG